ncbi:putative transporter [candidate division KSB1 bacterium]|nr:putative transporter [candidate division KSB1 bacterium]
MLNFLIQNQLVLLFTVIGLGYLLGSIKIGGFSFGVAAVLFVGIAFGAFDNRLDLPEYIYTIGLVLFVYAIGLQAGPGFFASFQKRGLRINAAVVLILTFGAMLSMVLWKILGVPVPSMVGLFCGALTNTPALAATVETIKNMAKDLPPATVQLYMNSPVVTYGLAYPFGVLGVILWFYVFSKFMKIDLLKDAKTSESDIIFSRTFRVTNPGVIGKTVNEALSFYERPGFVLSRIKKGDQISIVAPDCILYANDLIVAVGNAAAQERARVLFGALSKKQLDLGEDPGQYSYRRIFVSSNEVVGKRIRELALQKKYNATITRLRRGDVDFVPSNDTILELGDRIRVVTLRQNLEQVTQFFGDSIRSVSEADFLSLSLGIVLGVFVGTIPFPLPNGMNFKLGFAGGPLIVALILGRIERTGPITWSLPYSANLLLRQIGLLFFLAAIGTKAGHGFAVTFQTGGWGFIVAGAIITTVVTLLTLFVGYKFFKLPMSAVMGIMSGLQTQPACLAYANQQAQNELPNIWYATVYPAAMVAKIILVQLIISMFMLF